MKAFFWGTRGSLPASTNTSDIKHKLHYALQLTQGRHFSSANEIDEWIEEKFPFWVGHTYGTNTPCVELIHSGNETIFFDAGTGIRDYAWQHVNSPHSSRPHVFHIFLSHFHWDHIQGLPFFFPAYDKKNTIFIHGFHKNIEAVLKKQMEEPFFPISMEKMAANIQFITHRLDESIKVNDFKVSGFKQEHPGDSYGYRLEKQDKVFVYSTDASHKPEAFSKDRAYIQFIKNADLLIFDAMFTFEEAMGKKEHWGHSSNVIGIELASKAKVKHIVLFHTDPLETDAFLDNYYKNSLKYRELHSTDKFNNNYPYQITLAYDQLAINF